jgi:hypothetical protein
MGCRSVRQEPISPSWRASRRASRPQRRRRFDALKFKLLTHKHGPVRRGPWCVIQGLESLAQNAIKSVPQNHGRLIFR